MSHHDNLSGNQSLQYLFSHLPKMCIRDRGKTFKGYTQEDMTLIANHINSTTRPGLEYKRPYDLVETEEMKKLLEVLNMSPVAADEICLRPKLLSKE